MSRLIGALALALSLASCSWIVVQPVRPGARAGDAPGLCTRSDASAHVDAGLTLVSVVGLSLGINYAFTADAEGPGELALRVGLVAVPLLVALATGSSAMHGYKHAERCRRLERAYKSP